MHERLIPEMLARSEAVPDVRDIRFSGACLFPVTTHPCKRCELSYPVTSGPTIMTADFCPQFGIVAVLIR